MIEIFNDVGVVLIGIFGKILNYRGDSAQNFIFVLLFTSLCWRSGLNNLRGGMN